MRVPEQYLKLVGVFKEASRNFPHIFLYKNVLIIVQNENLQNENSQLGAERVKET